MMKQKLPAIQRNTIRRRVVSTVLLCALVGTLAPIASSLAQARLTQDGHALDNNLQVGSGGWNPRVANRQVPMAKPLYTLDSRGNMRYNRYNAFGERPVYTVNRSAVYDYSYRYQQQYRRTYRR